MHDPRLDGGHLEVARRDQYDASLDELLDHRGRETAMADPLTRPPFSLRPPTPRVPLPPGGTYTLVSLTDGRRHPLRVGINALGRSRANDILLESDVVSRRHCVVLVHVSGGCEVYDTASLNGTGVNGRRVSRVDLVPGDMLELCGERFLLAWVGAAGEVFPPDPSPDTSVGATVL